MNRQKFLKEQEFIIQKKWGSNKYQNDAPENVFSKFDTDHHNSDNTYNNNNSNKKFFVTFPFPYMNGRLHLGHAFTILKADVIARHYMTLGYNVLFPFGFHLTGIPIVAASNRLKQGDVKQFKIMQKMNIEEKKISKFTDPIYWIKYFPKIALEKDLPSIGCAIDYRRSFVTTDINPHFDSFVRWQFNKLNNMGHLKFGKKMVIFSEKDDQPCSHADRSVGEEVEIKEYKIAIVEKYGKSFFVTYDSSISPNIIARSTDFTTSLVRKNIVNFNQNQLNSTQVYIPVDFCRGIYKQNEIIEGDNISDDNIDANDACLIKYFSLMDVTDLKHGSCIYSSDPNLNWIPYYEPESEVISRSGDKCIVAATDQWYIMYDNPKWISQVKKYVTNDMSFSDINTKQLILDSIDKSHPWPFSRTFGMGSRIPFDEKYLIDSLSDSTIYMAYYTVSHLITKISKEELSDDVWDSIFFEKDTSIAKKMPHLFEKMRNEFLYWYPLDLRVSGKDLISNHLTMMLFNHMAIFGPEKMPKSIYTNGHILINGEKMSKGQGNFITLKEAVDKYGADVTRFIACQAGDNIDDGNFNEKDVDPSVLSLYAEIQNWKKYNMDEMRTGIYHFTDHIHLVKLKKILNKVMISFHDMKFRDVVKNGFFELQTIRNKYENPHRDIFSLYLQAELAIMSPIIPHWADYLSSTHDIPINWPEIDINSNYDTNKMEWLNNYCNLIKIKMAKLLCKKENKNKNITKCQIIINKNVEHFLENIIKFDTTDKIQRKHLVSMYGKKEMNSVVELFMHFEKMTVFFASYHDDQNPSSKQTISNDSDTFTKENLFSWLVSDNKEIIKSYISLSYPNIEIEILYDDTHGAMDPLNPIYIFK